MCLDKFTKERFKYEKYELNGEEFNVGYKIFEFRSSSGFLYSLFKGDTEPRPLNTWIHEKDCRLKTHTIMLNYLVGWHIYIEKTGALLNRRRTNREICKKVLFRTIVRKGYQTGCKVVVAKQIYILSDEVWCKGRYGDRDER